MKQQVNPVVALLIVAVALAAVWFVYTRVLTGQETGTIGPPSGVSLPPPPNKAESMPEMPRTKEPGTGSAAKQGASEAKTGAPKQSK